MNRKSYLFGRCAAIGVIAILVAATASARTVYDAGKAFNEAGHNVNVFGPWSFLHASGEGMTNTKAFDATAGASGSFAGIGGSTSPWIRVNTGSTSTEAGEEVLPNELLIHPADPKGGTESYPSDVVRFTAPEAGWYSANIFAHDTAKESNNTSTTNSGVQVSVRAKGNVLVRQIVSLEDCATNNPTHRFDFQMPVRRLAAGDKIEVVIGNKYNAWGAHSSDMTGLRFIVTKEDEGTFYDSGIAITNCIANTTTYENPYGTIKDGTWYYLLASVPAGTDFSNWGSASFNNSLTARISAKATRSDAGNQRGFAGATSGTSPYVLVNEAAMGAVASTSSSVRSGLIAPSELHAHPKAGNLNEWPTIRFRPPESGYYSASVVARDVIRGIVSGANGVDIYLLASSRVITNAYVSAETFSSTALLSFERIFLAAGEPVDIVIYSHGNADSDATAVSAIFRREPGDVYDAGKSCYENHAFRSGSVYFSDSIDDSANWLLAGKADPLANAHSPLSTYLTPFAGKLTWWTHASGTGNNGATPRIAMATNGIASVDSGMYLSASALLLSITPYEFVMDTKAQSGEESYCPSVKGEVPSNGIYRARCYVRDLNGDTTNGDGVRAIVSANGYTLATAVISRDNGNEYPFESAVAADRVWLKRGEGLFFTVDPIDSATSDATALSACYEKTGDAAEAPRVINIDITGSDGKHTGVGREGWSDWNKWNYMRFSGSVAAYNPTPERTLANCREADGSTHRNVAFTLKRDSGDNIAKGSAGGGSALHNIWAASADPSDTYTFTLSRLKAGEPYTLYLYSAKGGSTGNGAFTIDGVTKTADETWNLRGTKVLARFDVVSDANGEISGTFAAADSSSGGAFNGLTLVGEFPDYVPVGSAVVFR